MECENYLLVNLRYISVKHPDHLSEIPNYLNAHNKTQLSMNLLLKIKGVKCTYSITQFLQELTFFLDLAIHSIRKTFCFLHICVCIAPSAIASSLQNQLKD